MKVNSCRKGKAAERKACKFLEQLGFKAERAARNGVDGAHDLIVPSLSNVHIEVKSRRNVRIGTDALHKACVQANMTAALAGKVAWAVLWMESGRGWRLTFPIGSMRATVAWPSEIGRVLQKLQFDPHCFNARGVAALAAAVGAQ